MALAQSTVGIGGHGIMFSPICPCRITHLENGAIFFNPRGMQGAVFVAPGAQPATIAPSPILDNPRLLICGPDGPDEMIRFGGIRQPPASVQIKPPPRGALVEGSSPGEAGPIRTWQHTYEHHGQEWVQRQYALPLSAEATIVMSAQASRATWPAMEAAAETIAATFAPIEAE